MPSHQFTINPQGRTIIGADGVVTIDHLAEPAPAANFAKQPVGALVLPGLRLQLHGCAFEATMQLSRADALALIARLAWELGETLPAGGVQP